MSTSQHKPIIQPGDISPAVHTALHSKIDLLTELDIVEDYAGKCPVLGACWHYRNKRGHIVAIMYYSEEHKMYMAQITGRGCYRTGESEHTQAAAFCLYHVKQCAEHDLTGEGIPARTDQQCMDRATEKAGS